MERRTFAPTRRVVAIMSRCAASAARAVCAVATPAASRAAEPRGVAAFAASIRLRTRIRAAARAASRRAVAARQPVHHESMEATVATRCRARRASSSALSASRARRRRVQKKRSSPSTHGGTDRRPSDICDNNPSASDAAGTDSTMMCAAVATLSISETVCCSRSSTARSCDDTSAAAPTEAHDPVGGARYAAAIASVSMSHSRERRTAAPGGESADTTRRRGRVSLRTRHKATAAANALRR